MATCRFCRGKIVFRHVGGQITPIHLEGGWCTAITGSANTQSVRPYRTIESYTNPNAICPVCGETVFFYQSPHGGRVFFDALGWPWPKHPCTDQSAAQQGQVRRPEIKRGGNLILRDRDSVALDIYELEEMHRATSGLIFKFLNIRTGSSFRVCLNDAEMQTASLTAEDWRNAPSFVIAPTIQGHPTRRVYFICARHKQIVTMDLSKA